MMPKSVQNLLTGTATYVLVLNTFIATAPTTANGML